MKQLIALDILLIIFQLILSDQTIGAQSDKQLNDTVGPFPQVLIRTETTHLLRDKDTVLLCAIEEAKEELRLADIKWIRDGRLLENNEEDGLLELNGPVPGRLKGEYQCEGLVEDFKSALGSHRVRSSSIRIENADIDKFPATEVEETARTVEAIQGEVAYLPCAGKPLSRPGPAKIWFERKWPAAKRRVRDATKKDSVLEILGNIEQRQLVTNNGLQIGIVQPGDAGQYRCVALNPLTNITRRSRHWTTLKVSETLPDSGTSSSGSRISGTLTAKLVFPRVKETRLEAKEGDAVTLDCVCAGGQIRWEKVNESSWDPPEAQENGGKKGRFKQVWGNLNIDSVQPEDSGTYGCRVLPPVSRDDPNEDASLETKELARVQNLPPTAYYHLTVLSPSRANLKLERTSSEGTRKAWKVTCLSADSRSQPEVWLNAKSIFPAAEEKNEAVEVLEQQFVRTPGSYGWHYELADPLPAGVLQCLVGPGGFAEGHSQNLYIRDSPKISSSPTPTTTKETGKVQILEAPNNTTRTVGDSVTLICKTAKGIQGVVWLKDGQRLPVGTGRYRMYGSGTLEIQNSSETDQGWYTCLALGKHHNASAAAFLTIESTSFFGNIPMPTLDLTPVTQTPVYNGAKGPKNNEDQLKTTTPEDEDEYTVGTRGKELDEEYGSGTELLEQEITTPSPKKQKPKKAIKIEAPKVYQHGSNSSVIVQWRVEEKDLPAPIVHFKMQVKKGGTSLWHTREEDLPSATRQFTVDGLKPGEKYKFRVGIALRNGETVTSKTTEYREVGKEVKIVPPRLAPRILNSKPIDKNAFEIKWEYPVEEKAQLDGFIVHYRVKNGDKYGHQFNTTVEGSTTREHVLDSPYPGAPHEVRIVAFNSAGRSKESNALVAYTLTFDGHLPYATTATPTGKAGGRADTKTETKKERVTVFSLSSTTLFIILGGILGILILALITCMICCTMRQRKQRKMNTAAKGKFVDASARIFKEQQVKRTKVSLYHDALAVQLSGDDAADALMTATLFRPPESPVPSPHRALTPIGPPLQTQRNGYGPPTTKVYNSTRPMRDLDTSDEDVDRGRSNGDVRYGGSIPLIDEIQMGMAQEEDEDRRRSTPECDLQNGHSLPGFPLPPASTSTRSHYYNMQDNPDSNGVRPVYLSPYHQALSAAVVRPSSLAGSTGSDAYTQGSSPHTPLHVHYGGTNGGGDSLSASPSRRTDSSRSARTPLLINTTAGTLPANFHPAVKDGGSHSPLIPQPDWDAMWTRGGGSVSSLRRNPSDKRQSDAPQFYTFRPHSRGGPGLDPNLDTGLMTGSVGTFDSRKFNRSNPDPVRLPQAEVPPRHGYLSDS